MTQYLICKARNMVTGQTVVAQDLTGSRFELRQRALAEDMSQQLADKMTRKTGETWQGFVEVYTPSQRS
jgi:hypothetical protein